MRIPKYIWQTWKTHQVPSHWSDSPESIREYCPDWKYTLMDDKDNWAFVQKYYPEYLQLYESFDQEIYRADMIRYLLLYKYGGVYMDLDIKLIRPLEELFEGEGDLYLVQTPNWSGYTNSFMASVPKCKFWLTCIEKIKERAAHTPWYIKGDIQVLWTTGPGMITNAATEYDHPFVTIPYKLAHPCNICDHYFDRPCVAERSFVEELEGSSWCNHNKWSHFIICRWKQILAVLLILLLILLILIYWIRSK